MSRYFPPTFDYNGLVGNHRPPIVVRDDELTKVCLTCHAEFLTTSRLAKRCPKCRADRQRQTSLRSTRRRRAKLKAAKESHR